MRLHAKDLTLDEKMWLLMGSGTWETNTLDGKLYESKVTDGPHGMRRCVPDGKGGFDEVASTAYPSSEVLAQTWRPELAYETAKYIADDLIETGTDTLLAPGVNIKRNPLCGRNFEYFSEDPYVSGVFGREFIRGIQSRGCGATLKHYCCNNAEYSRFFMSSEVDERTLHEIYLEPFRIAAEAKPWATMCSYNPVNGTRMSENKKLYNVLRKDFGFDGLIMSDWEAVQNRALSAKAGLDLEMPRWTPSHYKFKEDFEAGLCSEEDIDACVERVLDYVYRCEEASKTRGEANPLAERLAAARKVAEEGIVLLKNDGVLPLASDARVSVTGEYAAKYIQGGGSSRIVPSKEPVTVADALKAALPEGAVTYQTSRSWDSYPKGPIIHRAINVAYENDVAIVCLGRSDSEGHDRENLRLPLVQEKFILDTAKQNPNTVVVLFCGAAIDMTAWIDEVAAVVWAGYPGEMGTLALADILTGKVNPSGRLNESFPLTDKDAPTYGQFYDAQRCLYSEGLLVGYRWYDTAPMMGKEANLLYPFGYGLTYSEFVYNNLETAPNAEGGVTVSFDITNISERDGAEVAQVYVKEVHPVVFRPEKELKAFKKVDIKAGETVHVELSLTHRDFAYYSTGIDAWTVNPGYFEILVGSNAVDIELGATIEIQ